MKNADIIDHFDLSFDPGDPANGSLYLCLERGTGRTAERDACVSLLRARGLWSDSEIKEVPDEHRDAYKEQLTFIEAVSYEADGKAVLIARFDHPKFPSSAARFEAWKNAFDGSYPRA